MSVSQRVTAGFVATIFASVCAACYLVLGVGSAHTTLTTPATNPGAASTTVSIDPYRAYDSREDVSGKIRSGSTWLVDVISNSAGESRIPANAKGVFYNLTYTEASGSGFLTVAPGDTDTVPRISSINFTDGNTSANAGFVALPKQGHSYAGQLTVSAGGGGASHFIIDITGYVK